MAKIEDCPGFETFGADVKAARKAKHLTRKDLAEKVNIESRYLANIRIRERSPACPSGYSLLRFAVCPWNTTLIQKSCGRKAKIGNVSATS